NQFGKAIEVFAWSEQSGDQIPTRKSIPVTTWPTGTRGSFLSICTDGQSWMNKTDSRMTAAWAANGQIGFAWPGNRSTGFPNPHVRVAVIGLDASLQPTAIVSEPHLWNKGYAFAYPAAGVSESGKVGLAVSYGG